MSDLNSPLSLINLGFAALGASAETPSTTEAENSRISAYSDPLTIFPPRTAPP